MDKIFDAIEAADRYAFYAVAGTAVLIGTCWAVGVVVVSKSFDVIRRRKH